MIDYTKIQLVSAASSNKVLIEGSGSFGVAALGGVGETFSSVTIPHGATNDDLLVQVAMNTSGGAVNGEAVLPWSSSDDRFISYTILDSTNLYIFMISSDSSGLGAPAFTVNYTYRVLVP